MPAATTPSTPKKCLAIDAPIVLVRPRIGPPAVRCADAGGGSTCPSCERINRQRSSSDLPACCRRASLRATCTPQPGHRFVGGLCTVAEPLWNDSYAQAHQGSDKRQLRTAPRAPSAREV